MDLYSPEWEEQQYQALAPKVQAIVERAFGHSRGARFGAQGSILAKRLAALRIEIATQAAVQKATIDETKRRETVRAKELSDSDSRQEAARRNEEMRRQEEKRLDAWQRDQDYTRGKRDWYEAQNEQAQRSVFTSPEKEYDDEYLRKIGFPEDKISEFKSRGKFGPVSSGQPGSEGVGGTGFSSPVNDRGWRDVAGYETPGHEVSPMSDSGQQIGRGPAPQPNGKWQEVQARKEKIGTGVDPASVRDMVWIPTGTEKHMVSPNSKYEYETSNWNDIQKELSMRGNRNDINNPFGNRSQNFTQPFASNYSGFNEDEKNKYLRKPGHGTSVEEGYKSGTNYTDIYNRDFGSGNWTPGGFRKTWRDTADTSRNIWSNLSSFWRG